MHEKPEVTRATSGPLPPWMLLPSDGRSVAQPGGLHIRNIPYGLMVIGRPPSLVPTCHHVPRDHKLLLRWPAFEEN